MAEFEGHRSDRYCSEIDHRGPFEVEISHVCCKPCKSTWLVSLILGKAATAQQRRGCENISDTQARFEGSPAMINQLLR
jgi:hypothetical protein